MQMPSLKSADAAIRGKAAGPASTVLPAATGPITLGVK
jgi:hypothetical protein